MIIQKIIDEMNNMNEARELWLETAYESNDEIPMPQL
jgi:predicted RNase H-like HicB family nuclease